jgi:hypothetical protein
MVGCTAEPDAIKPATTSADTVTGPDIRIGTTHPLFERVSDPDELGCSEQRDPGYPAVSLLLSIFADSCHLFVAESVFNRSFGG